MAGRGWRFVDSPTMFDLQILQYDWHLLKSVPNKILQTTYLKIKTLWSIMSSKQTNRLNGKPERGQEQWR